MKLRYFPVVQMCALDINMAVLLGRPRHLKLPFALLAGALGTRSTITTLESTPISSIFLRPLVEFFATTIAFVIDPVAHRQIEFGGFVAAGFGGTLVGYVLKCKQSGANGNSHAAISVQFGQWARGLQDRGVFILEPRRGARTVT